MRKIKLTFSSLWFAFLLVLPDEFSKFRILYYNNRGCNIHKRCSISANVRIRGRLEMVSGSSIAQNSSISGGKVGIFFGENVIIAPNVVFVAFNHGHESLEVTMINQSITEAPVIIENNVWIASNCAVGKGVRIGKGSIIGANSFVNKDISPNSIVGGVPAILIRSRM